MIKDKYSLDLLNEIPDSAEYIRAVANKQVYIKIANSIFGELIRPALADKRAWKDNHTYIEVNKTFDKAEIYSMLVDIIDKGAWFSGKRVDYIDLLRVNVSLDILKHKGYKLKFEEVTDDKVTINLKVMTDYKAK